MLVKILKRLLVLILAIALGVAAGFYSAPLLQATFGTGQISDILAGHWGSTVPALTDGKSRVADKVYKPDPVQEESSKFVSAGDAIKAVKGVPQLTKVSVTQGGTQQTLTYAVYQKPEESNPVWLIKVSEQGLGAYPDSWIFKVDGYTGQVMNIADQDLTLAGIHLGDTRKTIEGILGKSAKVVKAYDAETKQTVRTLQYDKITVVVGVKTGALEITTSSPEYPTIRGLKNGDPLEKLIKLYGQPDVTANNVLAYSLGGTDSRVFFVKMRSDKIVMISVEHPLTL